MMEFITLLGTIISIVSGAIAIVKSVRIESRRKKSIEKYTNKVLGSIVEKLYEYGNYPEKEIDLLLKKYFGDIPTYYLYAYKNCSRVDFIKITFEDYRLLKPSRSIEFDNYMKLFMRTLLAFAYCFLTFSSIVIMSLGIIHFLCQYYESNIITDNTFLNYMCIGGILLMICFLVLFFSRQYNDDAYTQEKQHILKFIKRRIRCFDKYSQKQRFYTWNWDDEKYNSVFELSYRDRAGNTLTMFTEKETISNKDVTINIKHK